VGWQSLGYFQPSANADSVETDFLGKATVRPYLTDDCEKRAAVEFFMIRTCGLGGRQRAYEDDVWLPRWR
jgi:hypothetical protein